MIASQLLFYLGCASPVEAPKCESSEDGACFKGVFKTLLGQPVQGVEICVLDMPETPCVVTDEMGQWKIPGLPNDTNLSLTAVHTDYVPSLFSQNTNMDWYDWYHLGR